MGSFPRCAGARLLASPWNKCTARWRRTSWRPSSALPSAARPSSAAMMRPRPHPHASSSVGTGKDQSAFVI
eukprot:10591579-Karenia_brevis.AAC.1